MMKKIIVLTALLGCLPVGIAKADSSCSSGESKLLEIVANGYKAGYSISTVEVGEAKLNYLQAQLACQEISKRDYCKQAVGLAATDVGQALNQMQAGTRSASEVIRLQRDAREIKSFCK
jgi:FMN-dependent NADH-azoreductase